MFTRCSTVFLLFATLASGVVRAENPKPSFYRGINLNGPPVTIDGQAWEGQNEQHAPADFVCKDKAFANQDVPLVPATDADRAKMIRSSRWGGNANDVQITKVAAGRYSVFLYVWEDNHSETFSISVNGREVVKRHQSGNVGHWDRLGPWYIDVQDGGGIRLTSKGGAANFSGLEIWRGEHDGAAAELTPENLAFFEKRIRPLLVKHCYECHASDSEEVHGELLVDSRAALRKGGSHGTAIVPGDLEQSLLIKAVRYKDDHLQMPPAGKLSAEEIADLEKWVSLGAPDPRTKATRFVKRKINLDEARKFWSFRPIQDPPVPAVKRADWTKSDIDRFILAELEKRDLQPASPADKRTLIRRATYDLTGLPPRPEDVNAFLADDAAVAFEKVIDRLLASRQYGERWGRHWMDLVRYADTAGENSDYPIPQAYLYRNYIIDSLNADKPYDQFIREQIAGDLLPYDSDEQRNEQIIATGYIAISRRFGSLVKDYPQHLTIEDTLENLGRTLLGLSISCSRCHDHKFDPLTNEDYYGLYGIFASTRYPFPGIELDKKPRDFVPLVENGKPNGKVAYAMIDGQIGDARVQLKGEPSKLGEEVSRRFPEVLGGQSLSESASKTSGRLQLANWITDPKNPLTARVMVNRIWQYHFGSGLVKTPSDFGVRGTPPTHPELLDWLATRFIDDGWSLKKLHKRLMLTSAYQLSSVATSDSHEGVLRATSLDPNNAYHWRFNRQRLDAEELRDTLLLLSGELDDSMLREPHPFPPVEKWDFTQHHPFRGVYDSNRRSVYLMTARLNSRPFFTTFDGADRNASTPKRDSSVTAVQSLYLLNDEFVHQRAAAFGKRLLHEAPADAARVERALTLTFARPPTDHQREQILAWVGVLRKQGEASGSSSSERDQQAWSALARVLFRANEFLYVD